MKSRILLLTLAFALVFCSSSAMAGDDWEFGLIPYLWFSGLNGQVSSVPGEPPSDVDASFSDILDNLDFGIFVAGEARKGRWGLTADVMYIDIKVEEDLPIPEFSSLELDTTQWMVSGAGFYRITGGGESFIDLLAGLRYWDVTNDLFLAAGDYPDTLIENSDSWVDPLVGMKSRAILGGSKFSFGAHALVGGFGAGSDLMWDFRGDFGYHWENVAVILGYRYLDVEYEDGDFLFDVTMDGPILGMVFKF